MRKIFAFPFIALFLLDSSAQTPSIHYSFGDGANQVHPIEDGLNVIYNGISPGDYNTPWNVNARIFAIQKNPGNNLSNPENSIILAGRGKKKTPTILPPLLVTNQASPKMSEYDLRDGSNFSQFDLGQTNYQSSSIENLLKSFQTTKTWCQSNPGKPLRFYINAHGRKRKKIVGWNQATRTPAFSNEEEFVMSGFRQLNPLHYSPMMQSDGEPHFTRTEASQLGINSWNNQGTNSNQGVSAPTETFPPDLFSKNELENELKQISEKCPNNPIQLELDTCHSEGLFPENPNINVCGLAAASEIETARTSGGIALIQAFARNNSEFFKKLDRNNDGSLNLNEVYEGLLRYPQINDVKGNFSAGFFEPFDQKHVPSIPQRTSDTLLMKCFKNNATELKIKNQQFSSIHPVSTCIKKPLNTNNIIDPLTMSKLKKELDDINFLKNLYWQKCKKNQTFVNTLDQSFNNSENGLEHLEELAPHIHQLNNILNPNDRDSALQKNYNTATSEKIKTEVEKTGLPPRGYAEQFEAMNFIESNRAKIKVGINDFTRLAPKEFCSEQSRKSAYNSNNIQAQCGTLSDPSSRFNCIWSSNLYAKGMGIRPSNQSMNGDCRSASEFQSNPDGVKNELNELSRALRHCTLAAQSAMKSKALEAIIDGTIKSESCNPVTMAKKIDCQNRPLMTGPKKELSGNLEGQLYFKTGEMDRNGMTIDTQKLNKTICDFSNLLFYDETKFLALDGFASLLGSSNIQEREMDNAELSVGRAQTVRDYILKDYNEKIVPASQGKCKQVAKDKIRAQSYGETNRFSSDPHKNQTVRLRLEDNNFK